MKRAASRSKEATHDRIVEAAARAIRRSGYNGTGVADIMKDAGLTHGGFYAHFPSREAMLAEAADRAGSESVAMMERIAATSPPPQALQAMMRAYLSKAHVGVRVSVIEPAYTKTQFDANFLAPDSKLDEYREVRALLDKVLKEVMATADEPTVVADVVLEAAIADRPKLRYVAGALANRLRLLRRFAPAGLVGAGIRKDLRLDAPTASLPRTPVLEK